MAANAQLVAVRVTEIRTIVVRMIVRPQTGFAFASSAIGDGSGVAPVHSTSVRSVKPPLSTLCWPAFYSDAREHFLDFVGETRRMLKDCEPRLGGYHRPRCNIPPAMSEKRLASVRSAVSVTRSCDTDVVSVSTVQKRPRWGEVIALETACHCATARPFRCLLA